jgi:hypothetical protein
MAHKPAKLLRITLNDIQPTTPLPTNDGTGDPWLTNAYLWVANISVTPQPHSSHQYGEDFYYTGLDIQIGDWIVTSGSGAALKINQINTATKTQISCVLEDVNRSNAFQNADQNGQGEIQMGEGLLFSVKNGLPILYPLPDALPGTIPLTVGVQLISRAFYENEIGKTTLELPQDGTFNDGIIKTWQPGITTYSDALDDLNKTLQQLNVSKTPLLYEITTPLMNINDSYTFTANTGSNIKLLELWIDNTTLLNTDANFRECECIVECHWNKTYSSSNPYMFKALKVQLYDDGTYYLDGQKFSGPQFIDLINIDEPTNNNTYWRITKLNQVGRVNLKFKYIVNQ